MGSIPYQEHLQAAHIPYLQPVIVILQIIGISCLAYHIYHDYQEFLSLGPGGTPASFPGYLKIKCLSVFALRDPYAPAPIPETLVPQTGYLADLPQRQGPRPVVKGIAPHRQQTQRPEKEIFNQLEKAIDAMADSPESGLVKGTSCFEKHGPGLFAVHPRAFAFHSYYSLSKTATKDANDSSCLPSGRPQSPVSKVVQRERRRPSNCPHEACHAHPSDGSLHMTLHPADAKLVLESGWGERHPLAKGGWLERFVPGGFLMVYAPRTPEEVKTVERIIRAAVWWIGEDSLEGEKAGDVNQNGSEKRPAKPYFESKDEKKDNTRPHRPSPMRFETR